MMGAHSIRGRAEKVIDVVSDRAWRIKSTDIKSTDIKGTDTKGTDTKDLAIQELKERIDEWAKEASVGGRILAYERKGQGKENIVPLLERPGIRAWRNFTVPMSMREVEPDVPLIMNSMHLGDAPRWRDGLHRRKKRPMPMKGRILMMRVVDPRSRHCRGRSWLGGHSLCGCLEKPRCGRCASWRLVIRNHQRMPRSWWRTLI